jgi:hypothetical protein
MFSSIKNPIATALENPDLFLSQACGIGQTRLHVFEGEVRIFFENLFRA